MTKFAPFILANWRRYRQRQGINLAMLALAFALFAVSLALAQAFSSGTKGILSEQLLVTSNISQGTLLPLRMVGEIQALPEVQAVSHASWFGGYYREAKNPVPLMAVDAAQHFSANPDFEVDTQQLAQWQSTRNGLMIGSHLAKQFAISPGQRFNLGSYLWRQSDGSPEWDFVVSGIYQIKPGSANMSEGIFMHYDYLNTQRERGKDWVNVIVVRLKNSLDSPSVAQKIDHLYANSAHETKTSSAAILAQDYLTRILNVNRFVLPLILLVIGSSFFIIATNVSNNLRHRSTELAVLKVLGFGRGLLYLGVLAEIWALFLCGAILGLLLAYFGLAGAHDWLINYLPSLRLSGIICLQALALASLLSLLASIVPALQLRRIDMAAQLRD